MVIKCLQRDRILPVAEISSLDHALPLVDALMMAGLGSLEVTLRRPHALETIALLRAERPTIILGAGTVLRVDQVDQAAESGASFVVSPGLNAAVVQRCLDLGLAVFPGIVTPTEVERLFEMGLHVGKLFPAAAIGGVAWIRALAGPYPSLRLIPTGGIRESELRSYLELPSVLACGGTWLADRQLAEEQRWEEIAELARRAVAIAAGTEISDGRGFSAGSSSSEVSVT